MLLVLGRDRRKMVELQQKNWRGLELRREKGHRRICRGSSCRVLLVAWDALERRCLLNLPRGKAIKPVVLEGLYKELLSL